jgi:peptidoglycan/LPS O-acetylase OafA/YrhL
MAAPRLSEVECLRGLAIALVVANHVHGRIFWGDPSALGAVPWTVAAVILAGHTGVSLFFVLSGFLLSRPFLEESRGGQVVSRRVYAVRRVLRVMPLYVLAVLVASVDLAKRPLDVLQGAPYLVFLNALPRVAPRLDPYSDPWWSLATEAQFYVLLPLLPLVLRTPRGRGVGVVLLAGYVGVYAALSLHWLRPATLPVVFALARSVVGRGPLFLAGIAAAAVYDRYAPPLRDWAARHALLARVAGDLLLIAALGSVVELLGWAAREDYAAREAAWPLWHVAEGIAWSLVLLSLLLFPGFVKRVLVNRAWAFLGLISYSLYLVHLPVIEYGRRLFSRLWIFPIYPGVRLGWTWKATLAASLIVTVALAIATLTHLVIERPMLRLKSRVRA